VSRYFPGYGVKYFGMSALQHPVTGAPIVDLAKTMVAPNAFETWVTLAHPMASKVGWMNVNNISSAFFSLPIGFLTIIVVSLMTKAPSQAMYDMIDQVRRPKGEQIMQEKSDAVVAH
jgi:cation/acetate symporter